jgi:ribose transport system substrate-binding protein
LVEPVEQAIAKGIPVVVFDSGLESKKISAYVATNNYNGGVIAAKRLGELLGGKGRIILLRYNVGSASTDEREKAFDGYAWLMSDFVLSTTRLPQLARSRSPFA